MIFQLAKSRTKIAEHSVSNQPQRHDEWSSAMFSGLCRVFDSYGDDEDQDRVGFSVWPALLRRIAEHWDHTSRNQRHELSSATLGTPIHSLAYVRPEDDASIEGSIWCTQGTEAAEEFSKGRLLLAAFGGIFVSPRQPLEASDSVIKPFSKCFEQALSDLHSFDEYLEPDEVQPPQVLINEVERLLHRIYDEAELPVEIYADPEGDVILSFSISPRDLVFVHCDIDGTAYCMVKISGERSNMSYGKIAELPDPFIMNALRVFSDSIN